MALYVRGAECPQGIRIYRSGANICDRHAASGFQDPEAFGDRPLAIGIRSDVVYRHARNYEIESRIREGKRPHVGGLDVHPIANAFQRSVAKRSALAVTGLVRRTPDIHAAHPARGQPVCDGRQHRAPATTHMKDHFVTTHPNTIQNALPFEEFATPGGVEKAEGVGQEQHKTQRDGPRGMGRHAPPAIAAPKPLRAAKDPKITRA